MADEIAYTTEEYNHHMTERTLLIEASRDSSKTFDQAMLTFGSAIFGFSVAFVKDVAPHPITGTLRWLGWSWALFSVGLLLIALSFLFSQKACDFEIEESRRILEKSKEQGRTNRWAQITSYCNYCCVAFLFLGMLSWSVFGYKNLKDREATVSIGQQKGEERGFVPPSATKAVPPRPPQPAPPPPKSEGK